MNKHDLHAFIERIKQGLRDTPQAYLTPMARIRRWFGRSAAPRRSAAPSGQTAYATSVSRKQPSVRSFTAGPLWRGPATPVPEHVRQHGIPFQSIGIDANPTPRGDMRAALASALDRIAALEQRQDERHE
jgi:hypothetical protein